MPKRNDLIDLEVREVSLVDDPANKGARVLLYKRDGESEELYKAAEPGKELEPEVEEYLKRAFSSDRRNELASTGAALPDGSFPIENEGDLRNAIRAIGRAKDPAKAKAHIKARAKTLGASNLIPDDWKGGKALVGELATMLAKLLGGKVLDDGRTVEFGKDAQSFEDAYASVEQREMVQAFLCEVDEACCALHQSVASIMCDDEAPDKGVLLRQTFEQFTNHVANLAPDSGTTAKSGGAATEEEMLKELAKALGLPETATEAEVSAAVAKALADGAAASAAVAKMTAEVNIAKMSQAHSDYADAKGMSSDQKAAFAAKTPAERDDHIGKNPVAKSAEAVELEKSNAKIAELEKRFAEQEGVNELAAIEKRVAPLVNIGKASEVAELIQKAGKVDKGLAESLETLFGALNKRIAEGNLFGELGSAQKGVADATAAIDTQARELMKSDPKLSIEKARTRVRDLHPELAAQEAEANKQLRDARRGAH